MVFAVQGEGFAMDVMRLAEKGDGPGSGGPTPQSQVRDHLYRLRTLSKKTEVKTKIMSRNDRTRISVRIIKWPFPTSKHAQKV